MCGPFNAQRHHRGSSYYTSENILLSGKAEQLYSKCCGSQINYLVIRTFTMAPRNILCPFEFVGDFFLNSVTMVKKAKCSPWECGRECAIV